MPQAFGVEILPGEVPVAHKELAVVVESQAKVCFLFIRDELPFGRSIAPSTVPFSLIAPRVPDSKSWKNVNKRP